MCAVRPTHVALICDSRGKRLQEKFQGDDVQVKVLYYSGAKLYQSTRLAINYIKAFLPDQIYILSGINTMTKLDKRTRIVTLAAPERNKIVQIYQDEMNFSLALLRKNINTKTKVIFAPLIGMNLSSYNKTTAESESVNQGILNDALLDINSVIIAMNKSNQCKTPWTQSLVHRYFRGKYHHYYERLDEDGCHLKEEVLDNWSLKLKTAIQANL